MSGGPFRFVRYDPGRSLEYEPNEEWSGRSPNLDRLTVSFVQSTELLVQLLAAGKVDAAALPSSVNLDDRLTELGLEHEEKLGWESIVLAFEREDVTLDEWIATACEIDSQRAGGNPSSVTTGACTNTLVSGAEGDRGFLVARRVRLLARRRHS